MNETFLFSENIHNRDQEWNTALSMAAKERNEDMVNLLLSQGADTNVKNMHGNSTLMEACISGNLNIMKAILTCNQGVKINSKNKDGCTALSIACHSNNFDGIKILLAAGSDINIKNNNNGNTVLMSVIEKGYMEPLDLILEHKNVLIDTKNNDGYTALMIACFYNRLDIIQRLIQHRADVDLKNDVGDTALMISCRYGHENVVRYLLLCGSDKFIKNDELETCLMIACEQGFTSIVQLLINHDTEFQMLELLDACMISICNGYKDIILILIKLGVDINSIVENGEKMIDFYGIDSTDNTNVSVEMEANKTQIISLFNFECNWRRRCSFAIFLAAHQFIESGDAANKNRKAKNVINIKDNVISDLGDTLFSNRYILFLIVSFL